ncbi:MAG TPA: NADH:ubiquinone oxidoreductase [Candidatus Latescibacteria bacterium]|nr:NADH:ubiquinone oxidoreductase [Candidatus Latescibacterota bacterium]
MGNRTVIPIGPYHPLQEEPEFFRLWVEGETVVDIDVNIGYNHRGIEKLCELKTYDQIPFVVERVCGICSTSHPLAFVNAVEDLADIEIPERARYIRSIIAELERIHNHLLWVGLAGHFLGYNTVWMWAWRYREPVLDILEKITGNRQNYAMMKVGGVRRDIEDADIPDILRLVDDLVPAVDMFKGAILDDPVLHARLKGIGVLTKEEVHNYGAVGPTARASGVAVDVRRDDPYAAYDLVDWDVVTQEEGDVFAKAVVRVLELYESVKIVKECLERLKKTKGEIDVKVKEIPSGEGIGHAEAPRGEVFHYVRSDGTNRPIRHKIKSPSYTNVPTFKATVIGGTISDATITLAAVDPCYSCTERVAVVDKKTGRRRLNGEDLVRLSQEKTERIKRSMGL